MVKSSILFFRDNIGILSMDILIDIYVLRTRFPSSLY